MKKLLLILPTLLLVGCFEEHDANREANLKLTKACADAGGIARFYANGWLLVCDFTVRDQINSRQKATAERLTQ